MARHPRLIVLTALLVLGSAAPSLAQDRDRPAVRREVTEAQAVQIARGYGMVEIEEIERDDGGWEIEGRDRRGREVEISINRDGRVTRVERSQSDDG